MKERMVVQMVNKYLIDNNIIFGNEIKMGIGIPDISIGVDIPNGTPFLDDYNILKLYDEIMSKKVVSIDDVYGLYNIDKSILKRYLKKLIEERIIEIKGEEVFIKNKINMNNRSKLISIEVKVKDWRSGLLQARRYLNFSDYSYLGLYVESVEKVDTQDFIDSGIGLLSISETEVTEIIKPKKSKSCDYILKHISISNLMKNKELKNIVATTLENTPINKIWKLKFAQ